MFILVQQQHNLAYSRVASVQFQLLKAKWYLCGCVVIQSLDSSAIVVVVKSKVYPLSTFVKDLIQTKRDIVVRTKDLKPARRLRHSISHVQLMPGIREIQPTATNVAITQVLVKVVSTTGTIKAGSAHATDIAEVALIINC